MSTQGPKSKFSSEYIIQKSISSGKSRVFLAKSRVDSKDYIIKVFTDDDISRQYYIQEQKIHSSLSHPNIIQHISSSQTSPCYNVISMEYAPHGDLFNFVLNYSLDDEKLIRTYFHHLIQGLQYLHSQHIAHLDIKLENLLLGQDNLLKIADFDLAQNITDESLCCEGGTSNYRPRELLLGTCSDFRAADIYSAGICLYVLMAKAFPFMEEEEGRNINLFRYDTYLKENDTFWEENEALLSGRIHFSQSLRDLLNKMWAEAPSERITLEEIIKTRWYNEPVYTNEELNTEINRVLLM